MKLHMCVSSCTLYSVQGQQILLVNGKMNKSPDRHCSGKKNLRGEKDEG
jgi:hypothetical protein